MPQQDDNPCAVDQRRELSGLLRDLLRGRLRELSDLLRDLLHVHPGAAFSTGPLAAALEMHPADVDLGLAMLWAEGLTFRLADGRWMRFVGPRDDDTLLPDQGSDVGRYLAQHAMIEWYLRRLAEVDTKLNPTSRRLGNAFIHVDPETTVFADTAAALEWFEVEYANIATALQVAVAQGWDTSTIELAQALWTPLRSTGRAAELARTQRLGAVGAARHHHALEPFFLARQGLALCDCGDYRTALVVCVAAVNRANTLNDPRAQATALSARARAHTGTGDLDAARRDLLLARDLDERRDARRAVALRDRYLGKLALHPKVDNPLLAVHHFGLAATRFCVLGDPVGCARARIGLAEARLRRGHHDAALTALIDVEDTLRAHGVRRYRADLAAVRAEIYRALGDTSRADAYLADAAALAVADPGPWYEEVDQVTAVAVATTPTTPTWT